MDLGECPKVHDLALRADYEKAQQKKDYYYDVEVSLLYFADKISFLAQCLNSLEFEIIQ